MPKLGQTDYTLTLPSTAAPWNATSSAFTVQVPTSSTNWVSAGQTATTISQTELVLPKSFGISHLQLAQATATTLTVNSTQGEIEACMSLSPSGSTTPAGCPNQTTGVLGPYYYTTSTSNTTPFYLENNPDFVTNPGDWYEQISPYNAVYLYPPIDPATGVAVDLLNSNPTKTGAYYDVIAPNGLSVTDNTTLVTIGTTNSSHTPLTSCSSSTTVSNIQFIGVAFSHSNFLAPNSYGYVQYADPTYFTSPSQLAPAQTAPQMPAAVALGCTNNITFYHDLFSQLSAIALEDTPYLANTNLVLDGNAFSAVGSDAIRLQSNGGTNTITSNLIVRSGYEYGGGGIAVIDSSSSNISHNDIRFVSGQGIAIANPDTAPPSTSPLLVEENILSNVSQDLTDAGAIYTNSENKWSSTGVLSRPEYQKISIAWNQINSVGTLNGVASVPAPYYGAKAFYMDFFTEGDYISQNQLSTTPYEFAENCETGDYIFNNNLSSGYTALLLGGTSSCNTLPPSNGIATSGTYANYPGYDITYPSPPGLLAADASYWSYLGLQSRNPTTTPAPFAQPVLTR